MPILARAIGLPQFTSEAHQDSNGGVLAVKVSQQREVSHAGSAEEMWDENFTVDHGLRDFLATHLTAWYLTQIVKGVSTRPCNCLAYRTRPLLSPVSFRFSAKKTSLSAMR